jgi:dTDP-4-amino-4,6-dideoxygalactose transaminase
MPARMNEILELAQKFSVPVVEDAAEALGSTYEGMACGSFGEIGILSFNGNKIITTSGGGALVSSNEKWAQKARFLSTQARDAAPHYQHSQIGYNYRMSNVLAGIGRAQLQVLEERVSARRRIFEMYRRALCGVPGVEFMPEASWGRHNRWLTTLTIDPNGFGANREDVRVTLSARNIEARPVWKPMHLQPVFLGCERWGGNVAANLFQRGLCLPSGSSMKDSEVAAVIETIHELHDRRA